MKLLHAFVEILSGIVRVGEVTDKYGKPYEFAVAFSSIDGKTAFVKALVNSGEKLSISHVRATIRALKVLGFVVKWERIKLEVTK